ncbi:hypothetical protein GCM10027079_19460 [Sediminivirga luteola]
MICSGECRFLFAVIVTPVFLPLRAGASATHITTGPNLGGHSKLIPLTQTEGFSGAYSAPDEKELSFGYWVWPSPNILDIVYRAQLGDARNGNNTSFFNDPEIEEQILDAQREPDPALREEKYAQLQQWFQDEAIAVGVYNFTYNVAISRDLHGVWQDQGNGLLNFNDAYFVE